ncbi:low specificity L-threonine aldolase [Orrella sp. NBD-18]|uniref:Low specificity L-threonine aldolase n=1 Tax=Sheuella amnicola TaxID=2707330 RepID=A0A6B2QTC1_9BURK|nr:beta-eliminating lyase-related protein [Sheuella amnicola]NDY81936.1 low specificity L-threonine aldolase [Sheuella amnicola]HBI84409.1 low specificity L-threonine aldolase [Alcaligenaceae bacterium]
MNQVEIEFRSDNCGRAAPELIDALGRANSGTALGYGGDELTRSLSDRFSSLFETSVRVFPIPTGTGANALALASATNGFDAVYCSPEAHIHTSECNSAGFFGQGLKVTTVEGQYGKVVPNALQNAIEQAGRGLAHKSQPSALNLVQATDMGAVYSVPEVQALGLIAKQNDMVVHMDGARFANALATLGCTPAELTWRAGVDILSFGVTKNGGLLTDAIVVFNDNVANQIGFHLRRAGMIWSKMRFASAQIHAYVENDLWLRLARQSNTSATLIANALEKIQDVTVVAPVQANEIFVETRSDVLDRLAESNVKFYRRSPTRARFVCRWDTTDEECNALIQRITRCLQPHSPC